MSEGRKFHLQRRLGAGAFGEVFLAEQDSGAGFRRKVAIKLLHAQHAGHTDAGQRMRDEARILGRLNHRHIVTVLDLVRLGDRWAVVMDYVEGADLERLVDALDKLESPFPPPAAIEAGAAVLSALDAAYLADNGEGESLGVIHRDIKPSNVLLTSDGEIKVLDFGVARVNLASREAMTGQFRMGTERYMAPERIIGEPDTPAGDVYATGATIVELILGEPMGRTPVLEDRHRLFLDQIVLKLRPRIHGPPEVVEQTLGWLRRSLLCEPSKRPTARDMSEALLGLSRTLEGDSLRRFARTTVPRVDDLLGTVVEEVEGVLSERSSSGPQLPTSSMTFAMDLDAPVGATPSSVTLRSTSESTEITETTQTIAMRRAAVIVPLAAVSSLAAGLGVMLAALWFFGPSLTASNHVAEAAVEAEATSAVPQAPRPVVAPEPTPAPAAEALSSEPTSADDAGTAEPEPSPPPQSKPRKRKRSKAKPSKAKPGKAKSVAVDPDAPRVSAAQVVLANASSLSVECGDVKKRGTASVRLRDFPAGTCTIAATYLGQDLHGTVSIQRRSEIACTVDGASLICR